jgi:uncharacterized protein (TIGR03437 family)
VEIKGSGLSLTEPPRIWQGSDFVGNKMPVQLDGVSATVNGKSAYLYFISPGQVNILTPPDDNVRYSAGSGDQQRRGYRVV